MTFARRWCAEKRDAEQRVVDAKKELREANEALWKTENAWKWLAAHG